jgi:hypothetical protein
VTYHDIHFLKSLVFSLCSDAVVTSSPRQHKPTKVKIEKYIKCQLTHMIKDLCYKIRENLGKGCVSVFIFMVVSVALEHDTPYSSFESGLGNPFISCSNCYKVVSWAVFESVLPSPWSCHSCVQEKFIQSLY